jgi:hypothetical protein
MGDKWWDTGKEGIGKVNITEFIYVPYTLHSTRQGCGILHDANTISIQI